MVSPVGDGSAEASPYRELKRRRRSDALPSEGEYQGGDAAPPYLNEAQKGAPYSKMKRSRTRDALPLEAVGNATKWFKKGQGVLVAVSGGVDSMVLLEMLHGLAGENGWKLTVAHFNHQLRGKQSDGDERLVRQTAKKLKIPCVVGRALVKAEAKRRGWSIEMAARELRHRFLAKAARNAGARSIALAHHQDDQVELFFLRLFRGAGGEGLAGMKVKGPSPINSSISLVRPLLNFSKTELRAFAEENDIRFSEDATNASSDFLRNRIRLKLLPFLRGEFGTNLDATILRAMEIVGSENELVRALAEKWRKENGLSKGVNLIAGQTGRRRRSDALPTEATGMIRIFWDGMPVAVQRQVIQSQLFELGVGSDFVLVEGLRKQVKLFQIGPGKYARRDETGTVVLAKAESKDHLKFSKTIHVAASESTTFGGLALSWKIVKARGSSLSSELNTEQFDADSLGESIVLRHWQPGDRFRLIGAAAARKLQDIFTDLKMPKQERRQRVVATTADGEIFWVHGVRIGERGKLRVETRRRLTLRWKEL